MSLSDTVCKCLDKLWTEEELCDFTVQIDDVSIKCHRVVLGACSPFFLGLLRSGMKEANEGRVVLQDISVSTFQLILKTLYTGEDVLCLDNFIEIWHAVNMLQIGFLVELCEAFAIKNIKLENFSKIFTTANLFDSKTVLSSVKTFMTQNIEAIYKTKLYLELSFDELFYIVRSNDLHFNSEYPVLEMVVNWAEYKHVVKDFEAANKCTENSKKLKTLEPVNNLKTSSVKYIQHTSLEEKYYFVTGTINCENNSKYRMNYDMIENSNYTTLENVSTDRFDTFNLLLSQVRTCIISPGLLMKFLEHRLIKLNDKARQIIVSAILKQASFRHGQWPTAGIYRQFHDYGSFCVNCMNGTGKFLMFDPVDEKRFTIQSYFRLHVNIQLVAFDNELYATGKHFALQTTTDLCVYSNNSWTYITEITGTHLLLASNDQYIYITSVEANVINRLNPRCNPSNIITFSTLPEGSVVTHVMSYKMYLLFFCTETVNGVEETAVHMLDLQAKSWTRLDNLDGPAKNIISFCNDDNHYVLQTNGSLWVLKDTTENIRFSRLAKMWNLQHVLYGAVVYGEKLVIFYKYQENDPKDTLVYKLDNAFHTVSYYKFASPCSNLIPFVLPKYCLSEYV